MKATGKPIVFFQEHTLSSYSTGLTKALSAKNVDVNLFTIKLKLRKMKNYGVNVLYFPISNKRRRKPIQMFMYYWLRKEVKNRNVGLLHINVASESETFLKIGQGYKIPIVYTNHYAPVTEPLETLDRETSTYEKEKSVIPLVCKNSWKVVTVSKYGQECLRREFGINSSVIYHGVDCDEFKPCFSGVKPVDPKDRYKTVSWVARFGHHPYKDPFTFIRAIPLVLKHHPRTRIIMVGKGFLKPLAVDLSRKLCLAKHLEFLDYVENLNSFYASMDVSVLTSFNDTFGLVIAEAMACGKPVIVSNQGAPKEVVGDTGLTFEYGHASDLADKIVTVLENEDLSQELGAKARKRVAGNFTWEKAAEKYRRLYEETSR